MVEELFVGVNYTPGPGLGAGHTMIFGKRCALEELISWEKDPCD